MKPEEMLEKVLENERVNFYSRLQSEEGITKEDLDLVRLDIAFSPVIPFKGEQPAQVTQLQGGDYYVRGHPAKSVSPEMLKVMRFRYLNSERK